MQNLFRGILQSPGKSLHAEYHLQCQDDSLHGFEGVETNLLDEPQGEAIIGKFRDITERKHAEEALQQEEQFFRTRSVSSTLPISELSIHQVQQFIQQRRRYTARIDGTQRTTRSGNERQMNTCDHQQTISAVSRMRYHNPISKRLKAHRKGLGTFPFSLLSPFCSNARTFYLDPLSGATRPESYATSSFLWYCKVIVSRESAGAVSRPSLSRSRTPVHVYTLYCC